MQFLMMSSALSDAGSTAGTRRPKEDKSLRIVIAAPRTSRPASQGNEERGGTRGTSPGALLPPSSCRKWETEQLMEATWWEELHRHLHTRHPGFYLLVFRFFFPRLFGDLGHGPILGNTLQIVAIVKRKKNEKRRAQEPQGGGGWGAVL